MSFDLKSVTKVQKKWLRIKPLQLRIYSNFLTKILLLMIQVLNMIVFSLLPYVKILNFSQGTELLMIAILTPFGRSSPNKKILFQPLSLFMRKWQEVNFWSILMSFILWRKSQKYVMFGFWICNRIRFCVILNRPNCLHWKCT